ncbi:hypothetical protein NDU88_004416 [Pleurodeles waltl]|uniref:Uncharacterized protein n=1 Tax=Pleurodeles waltl TaxID=8319 RepID=A0AAV7SIV7_PLEWA|nr:hypothetical protein NDU88_004416 [Pleurodeles waltl]
MYARVNSPIGLCTHVSWCRSKPRNPEARQAVPDLPVITTPGVHRGKIQPRCGEETLPLQREMKAGKSQRLPDKQRLQRVCKARESQVRAARVMKTDYGRHMHPSAPR